MARKPRREKKRDKLPDARFGETSLARFINILMRDGKKSVAEGIVYGSLDTVSKRLNDDPVKIFKKSLDNVKPSVEVKSRRVGGANYQVPVEVPPPRRFALAMRWLRDAARKRNEKTMIERLSAEMIEAYHNRGGAVKKREETHRMAEANKAFSHFQW
jgi:small subunit ribosomal protein S7